MPTAPDPTDRDHRWAYAFADAPATDKALLGGKGAGLAAMTAAGLPVPPGFTITTEACVAYQARGHHFPEGMWSQARHALAAVEADTGRTFGGADAPLLLSVRSGAAVSMPGMMDTVLNLGLNDETVEALAAQTGDARFAYDAYRRFVAMFGEVVMGVPGERFAAALDRAKHRASVTRDVDLDADALRALVADEKRIVFGEQRGQPFPDDPEEQLRMAIAAVFDSWDNDRARAYRRVHRIPDGIGTGVTVQAMVFGNMGDDSGTGVAFTRDPSTGETGLYGEYLLNAQGEDVVAGVRTPRPIAEMAGDLPETFEEFRAIAQRLETTYGDVQDVEFTVEQGRLWLLQTRTAKRTGAAAVRIAVDMVAEGVIDESTAVRRVDPGALDGLLHPTIDPAAEPVVLAVGLPASPGAATGRVAFSSEDAEARADAGEPVILVRQETSPDDFHGMVVSQAIVTARGGMTSHAAVVARGMGTPCVAGADALAIDAAQGRLEVDGHTVVAGDWITVDGATGRVLLGRVPTVQPVLGDDFHTLMGWADGLRRLRVRANADTATDARTAREFGAEGIGLCRTEHMFFGDERLAAMRAMILAESAGGREAALRALLPFQRADFDGLFRAMDGLPVTVRLLDPPLHEFLPDLVDLHDQLAETKLALRRADSLGAMDGLLDDADTARALLRQVERLREQNPMLGLRGCRLGLLYPEITRMQVRALFEAAADCVEDGVDVQPEVMVPLVSVAAELENQAAVVREVADEVLAERGVELEFLVGTMIELPRAALTAGDIAAHAEFFSFGTNDLTQTTFGLSRDDAGRFLSTYVEHGILADDPFQTIDREGVGELVRLGTERGRAAVPGLKVGVCGEHGGDPASVAFFHGVGLDYVSCSPFRVPVARLAAAHAALADADA
ncbi:pyruvate, phosphate dikinase [Rubrivirga sp. IMCC45206]|uniref:pyruvate, phosphate dikinase n=1 Tax=Rubrivirga sp. IMCC45206 TaxID=3391614 RepID=UPI00398FDA34